MRFALSFDMDNDAFSPTTQQADDAEVRKILSNVSRDIRGRGIANGDGDSIMDTNGNRIGEWSIRQ